EELAADLAAGRLEPLPVEEFPIAKAPEAMSRMAQARHQSKIVLTFEEAVKIAAPRGGRPIRSEGAYLVTGGLGALGLLVADDLAGRGARRLVLIGRHAPSPPAREALAALEEKGARVFVVEGDVALEGDVARA